MGLLSKLKSTVKKAVPSSVKDAVSKAQSKVSSFTKIAGTNLKNVFSEETLQGVVQGYQQGGLYGAIGGGAMAVATKSITELDKSGKYNPAYAYKQAGFPSKEEYDIAVSYGYDNYDAWKAFYKSMGVTNSKELEEVMKTSVQPSNEVGNGASVVSTTGEIVVADKSTAEAVAQSKTSNDISKLMPLIAVGAGLALLK